MISQIFATHPVGESFTTNGAQFIQQSRNVSLTAKNFVETAKKTRITTKLISLREFELYF